MRPGRGLGRIADRQRQPRQTERLLHAPEVGVHGLDGADEGQRPGVTARVPEQPLRVAVRQEVHLRARVVDDEAQVAQGDPQGAVAPPAVVAQERACPRTPQAAPVRKHLPAQLGELARAAVAGRMAGNERRALHGEPGGVTVGRQKPMVGVADEGEGEVVGIEVHGARHRLDPVRHRAGVPGGTEGMPPGAVGKKPVQHGGARALGHLDVHASVAVRDHQCDW